MYFREGNYKAALKNFSKVLEKCPDSDNSVRVALGHCNYHLGRKDQAKAWYKRAHEVDGTNSDALACMAVLDMADSAAPSAEEVRGQVEKLFAAHKYDPTNALAMNSLAEHFFNKQQYNKVIELCTRAVGKTRGGTDAGANSKPQRKTSTGKKASADSSEKSSTRTT